MAQKACYLNQAHKTLLSRIIKTSQKHQIASAPSNELGLQKELYYQGFVDAYLRVCKCLTVSNGLVCPRDVFLVL